MYRRGHVPSLAHAVADEAFQHRTATQVAGTGATRVDELGGKERIFAVSLLHAAPARVERKRALREANAIVLLERAQLAHVHPRRLAGEVHVPRRGDADAGGDGRLSQHLTAGEGERDAETRLLHGIPLHRVVRLDQQLGTKARLPVAPGEPVGAEEAPQPASRELRVQLLEVFGDIHLAVANLVHLEARRGAEHRHLLAHLHLRDEVVHPLLSREARIHVRGVGELGVAREERAGTQRQHSSHRFHSVSFHHFFQSLFLRW